MDAEAVVSTTYKRGKWITFALTIGTFACLTLAYGLQANLIVYLIQRFNIKSIDAAQINNLVCAATSFFPLVGAILADSFFGSFTIVVISCCFSFLGTLLLTLTSVVDSLRPKMCQTGLNTCESPSKFQYVVLYVALLMFSFGFGVSRFTLSAFGASQFDEPNDQDRFFNWFFFTMYLFYIVGFTGVAYIQDNVGWGVGYVICVVASFAGLIVFISGSRFYRDVKPCGSPFTGLARVVIASVQKMNIPNKVQQNVPPLLTNTLRFFNKAAIEAEGDTNPDGSIAKPWRMCTIQQVEDFKKLFKILPIWSSGIFVSLPIAVQISMTVLQALAMDRHLGHFKIPAGSMLVVAFISSAISLTFIDRFFPLLWQKLTRRSFTTLQRIGIGHVVVVLSMVASALVEKRRLAMNKQSQKMSATWLFPQLILAGIGEGFQLPGQVAFCYQEFPASLRNTSTAMSSLILGVSFYLSTTYIDIIRAHSDWLPNNIDTGRLDNVFWVLVILGTINFIYFLCCAKFLKYGHNVDKQSALTSSDPAN